MNLSPAVESILNTYDSVELSDIAEHGCASGCAREHIYYTETTEFFDKHEDDIENYMLDNFGDDFMHEVAIGCTSLMEIKNKLTWTFIELVAYDYMNQLGEGDDELYGEVA